MCSVRSVDNFFRVTIEQCKLLQFRQNNKVFLAKVGSSSEAR